MYRFIELKRRFPCESRVLLFHATDNGALCQPDMNGIYIQFYNKSIILNDTMKKKRGTILRIVEVVTHNEEWSKMFKEEATEINTIFGNEIINIHHIGSTAIQNIKAKPIIDILIEVKVLEQVDEFINGMEQIGYEYKGEFGIVGRRFLSKVEIIGATMFIFSRQETKK